LQKAAEGVLLHPLSSPGGGIGRHAGLKNPFREKCRFDPGPGYNMKPRYSGVVFLFLRFVTGFWSNNPGKNSLKHPTEATKIRLAFLPLKAIP
jgi:hypothetical protein